MVSTACDTKLGFECFCRDEYCGVRRPGLLMAPRRPGLSIPETLSSCINHPGVQPSEFSACLRRHRPQVAQALGIHRTRSKVSPGIAAGGRRKGEICH